MSVFEGVIFTAASLIFFIGSTRSLLHRKHLKQYTLGETIYIYNYQFAHSSHLKMDGWRTRLVSLLGVSAYCQRQAVSFRECRHWDARCLSQDAIVATRMTFFTLSLIPNVSFICHHEPAFWRGEHRNINCQHAG